MTRCPITFDTRPLRIFMDTYTTQEAQDRLTELVDRALDEHKHCRITSDKGAVIILPEETYHNLAVTLELLSTPGLLESLRIDLEAHEAVS